MQTTNTEPCQQATFLGLPAELRLQIYGHLFSDSRNAKLAVLDKVYDEAAAFNHYGELARQRKAILQVCRLTSHEAAEVLYNRTTFEVRLRADDDDYRRLMDVISSRPPRPLGEIGQCAVLRRIRNLKLEIQPLAYLYQCKTAFDVDLYVSRVSALLQALSCGTGLRRLQLGFTFPEAVDQGTALQVPRILAALEKLEVSGGVEVACNEFTMLWTREHRLKTFVLAMGG